MKFLKTSLLAALLLGAKQASALFDVSAFGGYTTVGMGSVNDSMDASVHDFANTPIQAAATHIKSGYYVGADASCSLAPFLKIGPRIEYVYSGEGELALSLGPTYENFYYDPSLTLYELGISSDFSLPLSGLSVQAGLWGGYGFVGGSAHISTNVAPPPYSTELSGSGFVGELSARVNYKIVPMISLGLDLGYRLANISDVDTTNSINSLSDQSHLISWHGDRIGLDFSGFNVGGNVSFNF